MDEKNIFIHIPKTGGTTINCVMNKSEWQTKPDFNYRHISHETKRSNSKDIFNPSNYSKYEAYEIFMLLRHPVDRIISEYYFIQDRSEFLSMLKPQPTSLKQYVENRQTQNYMIGFLVGKRMYDTEYVTQDDLELVKNGIRNLHIHVGIFEQYQESMAYFEKALGIKWPKKIDVKRITLNRPKLDEVSNEIRELIIRKNKLDFDLYHFCLETFKENTQNLELKNIEFKKNKYDYVIKYTERFCLLGLEIQSKDFIQTHIRFFEDLNVHLHKKLKIKDGKTYTKLWNEALVQALKKHFPETVLSQEIDSIIEENSDPLDQTKAIAKAIDMVLLTKDKKNRKKYNTTFSFDEKTVKKPSFFSFLR